MLGYKPRYIAVASKGHALLKSHLGTSILEAIEQHVSKNYVTKAEIASFFDGLIAIGPPVYTEYPFLTEGYLKNLSSVVYETGAEKYPQEKAGVLTPTKIGTILLLTGELLYKKIPADTFVDDLRELPINLLLQVIENQDLAAFKLIASSYRSRT